MSNNKHKKKQKKDSAIYLEIAKLEYFCCWSWILTWDKSTHGCWRLDKDYKLQESPIAFWQSVSEVHTGFVQYGRFTGQHHIWNIFLFPWGGEIRCRALFIWKFGKVGKKARTEKEMTWILGGDNDDTESKDAIFSKSPRVYNNNFNF